MNNETAYQDAVDYIHSLVRFGWKPGLERFAVLCERLGNPQDKLKCIHVAGTNGKGSVTVMISSILKSAGYKVGSYFSPFVYDIRERVQLNGSLISKSDFTRLTEQIRPIAAEIGETALEHPTEFEFKTALALVYFAEQNVDFAVLEVGLGGRLDATNIVNPLVSVITNVTMDHMEHLGNTIPEIAYEKAGIIKQDGHLVTAAMDLKAVDVLVHTCHERNSLMWHVRPDSSQLCHYSIKPVNTNESFNMKIAECLTDTHSDIECKLSVDGMRSTYNEIETGMQGGFQNVNAATAIGAIEVLQCRGIAVSESDIREGLKSAYLPGRLEILHRNPYLMIDGAHNLDAANKLADALKHRFEYEKLIMIMGMASGHVIDDVVGTLAPLADLVIAVSAENERSAPAPDIADCARKYCTNVMIIKSVKDAVCKAMTLADKNDMICVAGSFYVLNEVPLFE
ncbi:MAG: bifunctional folylpolyglutamate synthase/dihydrofolate synthase [Armatimonadota bacterium]